jgi:hypothetical protein
MHRILFSYILRKKEGRQAGGAYPYEKVFPSITPLIFAWSGVRPLGISQLLLKKKKKTYFYKLNHLAVHN